MLHEHPPHRYLFQCFVYHFHLLELSESIIDLVRQMWGLICSIRMRLSSVRFIPKLTEVHELDENRTAYRVWWPVVPWKNILFFVLNVETQYEGSGPDDDDPGEHLSQLSPRDPLIHTLEFR